MEVIVYDIFRRGSKDLVFTKEFNLPFIPQKGIRIIDNNDNENEVILELDDERKRRVLIDYEYQNNRFIVDIVRNMLWEKMKKN